jgi:hypothetical protein
MKPDLVRKLASLAPARRELADPSRNGRPARPPPNF